MRYMGGKFYSRKQIVPIMLESRKEGQWWVEPFVGGGWTIEIAGGDRLGGDANPYTIEALKAIRDHVHELPKSSNEFTEQDYNELKAGGDHRFKGYLGFVCAYSGKFLDSWGRNTEGRDYLTEAYNSALRQAPGFQGIELKHSDYRELDIPANSLIYYDPPYEDKEAYKDTIDHDEFWQWCRDKSSQGHTVFVSEYSAPDDFECVFEKKVNVHLTKKAARPKATEKLFTFHEASQ